MVSRQAFRSCTAVTPSSGRECLDVRLLSIATLHQLPEAIDEFTPWRRGGDLPRRSVAQHEQHDLEQLVKGMDSPSSVISPDQLATNTSWVNLGWVCGSMLQFSALARWSSDSTLTNHSRVAATSP